MTPPELSREIHAAVPGSQLHVLPGCGHLPPIERPQELAGILEDLMRDGG